MNKIEYILSENEVELALTTAGVIKPYKRKCIIFACFSVVLAVLSFSPSNLSVFYMLLAILFFANAFLYFGSKKERQNIIKSSTTGELTELYAYDDYINVKVEAYDADWNIEKQDVHAILENDEQLIIHLKDGRLMPIPKNKLTDDNKPGFEKVLNYFSDIETNKEIKELGE